MAKSPAQSSAKAQSRQSLKSIDLAGWQSAIEAIRSEGHEGDDGLTTREIAEQFCIGIQRAQAIVRDGVRSGALLAGKRTVLEDWDGVRRTYSVYRPAS